MAATWESLHKQACNALQSQIDDAVVTYNEVFHPPDLFIMYVRMDHPGWSDKAIIAEARKRYNAHFGIGGDNGQTKTG